MNGLQLDLSDLRRPPRAASRPEELQNIAPIVVFVSGEMQQSFSLPCGGKLTPPHNRADRGTNLDSMRLQFKRFL
jgi:hypothetical protein